MFYKIAKRLNLLLPNNILLPQFPSHHHVKHLLCEAPLAFLLLVFEAGGGFYAGEYRLHPIPCKTAGGVVLDVDVAYFAGVFGADHGVCEKREESSATLLNAVFFVDLQLEVAIDYVRFATRFDVVSPEIDLRT